MNGANLNATDENGNSALLLAAEKGDYFTFKVKMAEQFTKLYKKKFKSQRVIFATSNIASNLVQVPKVQ